MAQNYGQGGYGAPPLTKQPYEYYLDLISRQYQNSPKFMAWLGVIVGMIDDYTNCLFSFDTAFHLDYAIGEQLDMLGAVVGASRILNFQPSNGVSPVLDDETYRLYIRAKVAQNQWDGTVDGLQTIWKRLFPSGTINIQDQQNMTAVVIPTGTFSSIIIDMIQAGLIVPRPAGVLYNIEVGQNLPFFGTDEENGYISGWDVGHIV